MITAEELSNLIKQLGTAPVPTDAKPNETLSTLDGRIFRPNRFQRPVDLGKVQDFIEAFLDNFNKLRYCLVIVDKNHVLIDGQHKVLAAMYLGLQIWYIIDPNADPRDSLRYGDLADKWKVRDMLGSQLQNPEDEKVEYQKLEDFCKKYDFITLTTAVGLCSKSWSHGVRGRKEFGRGQYKADNLAEAVKLAEMALTFKPWCTWYGESHFIAVLKGLSKIPGYNHKHMLQKLNIVPAWFRKQAKGEQYYEMFNNIYNYKTRPANRLRIEAPAYQPIVRRKDGYFGKEDDPRIADAMNSHFKNGNDEDLDDVDLGSDFH